MEFKNIIRFAVTDYCVELLKGTKDTKESLEDDIQDLITEFNPQLCMKMYASTEDYEAFKRDRELYWDWTVKCFEEVYRKMIGELLK